MIEAIKGLFDSKKALAAIISSGLAVLAAKLGVSNETIALCLAPVTAYILGQGFADLGKEAAKSGGAS